MPALAAASSSSSEATHGSAHSPTTLPSHRPSTYLIQSTASVLVCVTRCTLEWIVLHWIEYCIWCAQRMVRLGSLSTQSLCAENGLARCCGHAADQSVRIHVYRGRWSSFTLRWTAESRSSIPHTRANDWPWVRRWKRVDEGTKPLSSFGTFCALLFG